MLAMKENRANIINDLTSGKVSKEQLNQRMQMNSEAEEAKLDAIVKPEYLKQNMNQNINIPTEVAWRECAH